MKELPLQFRGTQVPKHLRWMEQYYDLTLVARALADHVNGVEITSTDSSVVQHKCMHLMTSRYTPWGAVDYSAFNAYHAILMENREDLHEQTVPNYQRRPLASRRFNPATTACQLYEDYPGAQNGEHPECQLCGYNTKFVRPLTCGQIPADGQPQVVQHDYDICRLCHIHLGCGEQCIFCRSGEIMKWTTSDVVQDAPEHIQAQQARRAGSSSTA